MKQNPVTAPRWVHVSIFIGVGFFILALTLSAIFVPQLRLPHLFQPLIYVAIVVSRPDTRMVMGGGMDHFLLQLRPGMKHWGQFFAGGLLALAYLVLIVATAAPH